MKKINEGSQRKSREKHAKKRRVFSATPSAPIKMRVKKGDTVKVLSGKDKGKTGEVLRVLPRENRVIVEGIAVAKRHLGKTGRGQSGRIVERPAKIHASNVVSIKTSAPKEKKAAPKKKKEATAN